MHTVSKIGMYSCCIYWLIHFNGVMLLTISHVISTSNHLFRRVIWDNFPSAFSKFQIFDPTSPCSSLLLLHVSLPFNKRLIWWVTLSLSKNVPCRLWIFKWKFKEWKESKELFSLWTPHKRSVFLHSYIYTMTVKIFTSS